MWGNAGSGGSRTASLGDALASCAAHASEKKKQVPTCPCWPLPTGPRQVTGYEPGLSGTGPQGVQPLLEFRTHSLTLSLALERGVHPWILGIQPEPKGSCLSLLEKATPRGDVPRGAFVYLRSEPQSCARPAPEGALSRAVVVTGTGHVFAPVRRTQRPLGLVLHDEQGLPYLVLGYGSQVPCVQSYVEAPSVVELVGIVSMCVTV